MEKVERYRQIIQELLQEYSEIRASNEEVEAEAIFDTVRDHYQVVHVGWANKRRVYGCVLHLDIKDGKIWIQHDGTEGGIANELVAKGVPKADIVLRFHSPFKRQFTEFAVG
ncbi:XisI protein [Leptolyngbya sp. NK1-12]|uniref:XisI protein n=1 Tax=Leptolyngbya sp. NK1-12 TaxID=2547451 RepID=A0AA96WGT0_9CYAN|nr:XisI protein [Leptolyngbya sp. NK1-12]WNZ25193.1 XisI protein [Leptolyngbya sp. NK1-12]